MLTGKAIMDAAQLVGRLYAGTASAGSTTTLTDSLQKPTSEGFFTGGVIGIVSGVNANLTRRISGYDNAERKFYWSNAMASTISAGDRYVAVRSNISRDDLLTAINQALDEIGYLTQHDDTLLTLEDTDEYSLPATVRNVVRVEIASDDAVPYGWKASNYWFEVGGELIFNPGKAPSTVDMPIRLWYNAKHAIVTADADEISDYIHPERLAWTAAYYAAYNRSRQVEKDEVNAALLQLAGNRMVEMSQRFPIRNLEKQPRLAGW